MVNSKTLVVGASENPARYSHLAIHALRKKGHDVVALAKRQGIVADVSFQTEFPVNQFIHTVTLYVGPQRQREYFDSLLKLKPKRVIFNPGTQNSELKEILEDNDIETLEACTLVLLGTGQY